MRLRRQRARIGLKETSQAVVLVLQIFQFNHHGGGNGMLRQAGVEVGNALFQFAETLLIHRCGCTIVYSRRVYSTRLWAAVK